MLNLPISFKVLKTYMWQYAVCIDINIYSWIVFDLALLDIQYNTPFLVEN